MDRDYGLFVLLRHPEGYETMYGHASRLLVAEGDLIQAGQVIALTGSSGRSTAPHLHFEIRREGTSLDPLTMVRVFFLIIRRPPRSSIQAVTRKPAFP